MTGVSKRRLISIPPDVAIDSQIGPYRLGERVGSGGMGTVYLAIDDRRAGAHRFVAIKCIHPHLSHDRNFVDMFIDEAEVASLIDHPNVVRVLDFGQIEHGPYLVMEHLAGESLARMFRALKQGRCPWSTERRAALVTRVIADACEGLHAAHELCDEQGRPLRVVHRDVSPQNVFVNYDGIVKVLDFGTLKAAGQRHRTGTGLIKGKCAYIAPEILLAQPFDRRADVWSLGVLLWELLTQKRLFRRAHDAATVRAILEQEVPRPSAVDPSLPAGYDAIVLAALHRDPRQRFASARELGRSLQTVLVQTGQAVDLAAVAEWMTALFENGREDHRRTLSQMSASFVVRSDDAASTQLYGNAAHGEAQSGRGDERPPAARPHLWLATAAVVLASLAVVLVAWRERAPATEMVVTPPAPPTEHPPASVAPEATPRRLSAQVRKRDRDVVLEVWSTDDEGESELLWFGSVAEDEANANTCRAPRAVAPVRPPVQPPVQPPAPKSALPQSEWVVPDDI